MDAVINLKMTPAEFDLLREAVSAAIKSESELRGNMEDEAKAPGIGLNEKLENVQARRDSTSRQAQLADLLTRLR